MEQYYTKQSLIFVKSENKIDFTNNHSLKVMNAKTTFQNEQ
jgi:hypothetical protein